MLDGGAHFYGTYETSDGKFICVGSIEPQFYELLVEHSGVNATDFDAQMDRDGWVAKREVLTAIFKSKTRDEWCTIMEGTDICFAPVLSIWEAPEHPHNQARQTFVDIDGVTQPAPSPRFSRSQAEVSHSARAPGQDTRRVLLDSGFDEAEISTLFDAAVVG